MTTTIAINSTDHDDYQPMLDAVHKHFEQAVPSGPLFTTDADPERLWDIFLEALPFEQRQQHRCHCCRHFVQRYGNLVTIGDDGLTESAVFARGLLGLYGAPFDALNREVRTAKVTGVLVTSEKTWGTPRTPDGKRPGIVWRHMSVAPPKSMLYTGIVKAAHEVMAEKREEYGMLCRALADYSSAVISQALAIVEADAVSRAEKFVEHLRWLADLQTMRTSTEIPSKLRANLTWVAVAKAPAGWCHVKSGMVGTLLEDIRQGLPFEDVKRKFNEKMHPLQYRRPTAAPTAGNIKQAEEIVAKIGAAGSLRRRYARVEDVLAHALWSPPAQVLKPDVDGGVFAHLRAADKPTVSKTPIVAPVMTWSKFQREVLGSPTAGAIERIECLAPSSGNYTALMTAVDPEAPPIIMWDSLEQRNPVNWYTYVNSSPAHKWGLRSGAYVQVNAVVPMPNNWQPGFERLGEGVIFLLEGCRDTGTDSGLALFPEVLRAEFHPIRATIEAHSSRTQPDGREEATACGLALRKGQGSIGGARLRVHARGIVPEYQIDRWD